MRRNPFIATRESAIKFYTPKEIPVTIITRPGVIAEVHTWTDKRNQPCAVAWHGKANKPDFNEYYYTEAQRASRIERYFDGLQAHDKFKAECKAERKDLLDGIEVGAIMVHTWGYDQTNVDFFQVVSRTAKTLTIRELAHQEAPGKDGFGWTGGYVLPVKDSFTTPAQVVRSPYRIWDGKPEYYSHDH